MPLTGPRKYASDCLRLARLATSREERILMIRQAAQWSQRDRESSEQPGIRDAGQEPAGDARPTIQPVRFPPLARRRGF